MQIILCFLGVLYIFDLLNRNAHKLLPEINMSEFFINKLQIHEIDSLKSYISAQIKIHKSFKSIKNLNDNDLSEYDLTALYELKQYTNNELRQYVKRMVSSNITGIEQFNNHVQCTLKHGIIDFYLSQNSTHLEYMRIKFQSFSQDAPSLDISPRSVSYTYKIKSKHIRFINPNVRLISEIKEIFKSLNGSREFNLQAA